MKKIFIFLMFSCLSFYAIGQSTTTTYTKKGSTYYANTVKSSVPAKLTGEDVDIKGIKYPIYKTAKGKFYIVRTSKAGKEYKQYLDLPS